MQGAPLTNGFELPRQSNTFYYLCGIETPGSYLVLDGRSRRVTLFLPPRNERLERSEGKVLSADDAERVKALTGVDDVRSTAAMAEGWPLGRRARGRHLRGVRAGRGLRAEPRRAASGRRGHRRRRLGRLACRATAASPSSLRTRNPRAPIQDLTPILDALRAVKSPREIALVRRASQLAGLGLMEAMRSTEAGVYEYQLDAAARYVFLLNDARLDGYRSITAAGTENINNGHYFRNSSALKDGDLVLMDYAPDYRYYVSDIGRVWPVSGRYLPWQRELLQFILEYRNAVLVPHPARPHAGRDQRAGAAGDGTRPGPHALLQARLRGGGAQAARNRRRYLLAHGRHGGARRRQLPRTGRFSRARSSPSTRSSGCRKRTCTCATRTRSW